MSLRFKFSQWYKNTLYLKMLQLEQIKENQSKLNQLSEMTSQQVPIISRSQHQTNNPLSMLQLQPVPYHHTNRQQIDNFESNYSVVKHINERKASPLRSKYMQKQQQEYKEQSPAYNYQMSQSRKYLVNNSTFDNKINIFSQENEPLRQINNFIRSNSLEHLTLTRDNSVSKAQYDGYISEDINMKNLKNKSKVKQQLKSRVQKKSSKRSSAKNSKENSGQKPQSTGNCPFHSRNYNIKHKSSKSSRSRMNSSRLRLHPFIDNSISDIHRPPLPNMLGGGLHNIDNKSSNTNTKKVMFKFDEDREHIINRRNRNPSSPNLSDLVASSPNSRAHS